MTEDDDSRDLPTLVHGQFGLKGLLLSMFAGCALMTVAAGMFREGINRTPSGLRVVGPIFAPILVMVVLGIVYRVTALMGKFARRRSARPSTRRPAGDE